MLTKQLNVDLLQRVHAAELVELVVDLVEDEGFVVVGRVVLHDVIHCDRRSGSARATNWGFSDTAGRGAPARVGEDVGWGVPAFGIRKFTTSIRSK